MKRLFCSVFVTLLFSLTALAQNEGINFQGVARNAAGEVLVSQNINLRLSILLGSETGTVAYVETRQVTTNPQGVFAVVVGDDKALTKSTNFSTINWTPSPKFIKVEMDPNAGSNYLVMGTSRLQAVPFAFYANGVDASNVKGVLPVSSGGTGESSISDLKTSLGLDQVNNAALDNKVDKVAGKGLSTNDFTTAEKNKLAAITGTITGGQDLSGYATTAELATKANAADVTTSLATKVDKVSGKELSTNDFTTAEKNKLAAITGTNTGDQDLSGYSTTAQLASKANTSDVTTNLATKVDKVTGKGLSTNDYTTAEKNKLAAITGTNTGDQDLSGYATTTQVATKANVADMTASLATKSNTADVTTSLATKVDKVSGKELSTNDYTTAEKNKLAAITGTNTGDQDLSGYATTAQLATKANTSDVTTSLGTNEDISNKSNAALGTSTTLFPTQNAVKTYVDAQISNATIADADATTRGKIQLAGDLTGSATSPAIASGAVTSTKIADATIVNADIATAAAIEDTKLATIATAGKVSNSATTATSVNTNSAIVARDASGNFNAGTITLSAMTASKPVFTDANKQLTSTGTLEVSQGGTGVTTTPTNGQILIGNGSGFTLATLTAGTGITITNTSGTITIAASAVAVRPTTDQFSATENQLNFTLTQTPLTNANSLDNVWMFINGVRTNNLAYSVSGTTVTYVPGSNMNYALVAGDRIQFDYAY
jgi:hypothetical protein